MDGLPEMASACTSHTQLKLLRAGVYLQKRVYTKEAQHLAQEGIEMCWPALVELGLKRCIPRRPQCVVLTPWSAVRPTVGLPHPRYQCRGVECGACRLHLQNAVGECLA